MRISQVSEEVMGDISIRSTFIPRKIYDDLIADGYEAEASANVCYNLKSLLENGAQKKASKQVTKEIINFVYNKSEKEEKDDEEEEGKKKKKKEKDDHLKTQMTVMTKEEYGIIKSHIIEQLDNGTNDLKDMVEILNNLSLPMDLALFGRFCTGSSSTVESAFYASHAFSVNEIDSYEEDYYTAEDSFSYTTGAGHMGERYMASGVIYRNLCIDLDILRRNLKLNTLEEAADKVADYIPAFRAQPTGHSHQDAAFCLPHLFFVAFSNTNINWCSAYEQCVKNTNGQGFKDKAVELMGKHLTRTIEMFSGDHKGHIDAEFAYYAYNECEFPGENVKGENNLIKWIKSRKF